MTRRAKTTALLLLILAAIVTRLWILPLRSGFWVDEMVTAFLVHYGPSDPSIAVAPQIADTIYTVIPQAAERLFGFSEVVYRLPSTVLMAIALFLIARLASRLIRPEAAWFAAFACLTMRLFNYEAGDARPYALGTCVAAASLLFLVRWLDSGAWRDGILFAACGALLWRVHLVYWPFYLVLACYTAVRLFGGKTRATWLQAASLYGILAAALVPVVIAALPLLREAGSHVIVDHLPGVRDLNRALKLSLVLGCGGGAWLLNRIFRWSAEIPARPAISRSAIAAILGWWLVYPLSLFLFSWITGNSVFIDRYLSLSLPGAALAATLAVSYFLPDRQWIPASAALGIGTFFLMGHVADLAAPHHNSGWREASLRVNQLHLGAEIPVVYPSPFIEAQSPVWRPDYALPGFLYCHLLVYPITGRPYLFPFKPSADAERYAASIASGALSSAGRFVIYGGDLNVYFWQKWFAARPELAAWHSRRLGPFGDVDAVVFERPPSVAAAAGAVGGTAH